MELQRCYAYASPGRLVALVAEPALQSAEIARGVSLRYKVNHARHTLRYRLVPKVVESTLDQPLMFLDEDMWRLPHHRSPSGLLPYAGQAGVRPA